MPHCDDCAHTESYPTRLIPERFANRCSEEGVNADFHKVWAKLSDQGKADWRICDGETLG